MGHQHQVTEDNIIGVPTGAPRVLSAHVPGPGGRDRRRAAHRRHPLAAVRAPPVPLLPRRHVREHAQHRVTDLVRLRRERGASEMPGNSKLQQTTWGENSPLFLRLSTIAPLTYFQ